MLSRARARVRAETVATPQPQAEPQAGDVAAEQPAVVWVGQQWRMEGYCGRATDAAAEDGAGPLPLPRLSQERTEALSRRAA